MVNWTWKQTFTLVSQAFKFHLALWWFLTERVQGPPYHREGFPNHVCLMLAQAPPRFPLLLSFLSFHVALCHLAVVPKALLCQMCSISDRTQQSRELPAHPHQHTHTLSCWCQGWCAPGFTIEWRSRKRLQWSQPGFHHLHASQVCNIERQDTRQVWLGRKRWDLPACRQQLKGCEGRSSPRKAWRIR